MNNSFNAPEEKIEAEISTGKKNQETPSMESSQQIETLRQEFLTAYKRQLTSEEANGVD